MRIKFNREEESGIKTFIDCMVVATIMLTATSIVIALGAYALSVWK